MLKFAEILVVDDEISITRALKREFRGLVSACYCANSVGEAFEILATHRVNVVITDYRMPGETGVSFLMELQKKYPDIVALMISGQADINDVAKTINSGMLKKYIAKPWNKTELHSQISDLLTEQKRSDGSDWLTGFGCWSEYKKSIQGLYKDKIDFVTMVVDINGMDRINTNYSCIEGNNVLQRFACQLEGITDAKWYRLESKFYSFLSIDYDSYLRLLAVSATLKLGFLFNDEVVNARVIITTSQEPESNAIFGTKQWKENTVQVMENVFLDINATKKEPIEDFRLLCNLVKDIETQNFQAFFQPQLDLNTNSIETCEALVRRKNSQGDFDSPILFLADIERFKLLDKLTELMIRQVFSLLNSLIDIGQPITVSINITAKQLESGYIYDLLKKYSKDLENVIELLELELVETDKVEDFELAAKRIEEVKSLGVTFALDDFGTGFSGFESLLELPFDVVKIDGRFISAIGKNVSDEVILGSITSSAKSLRKLIVAEWVEQPSQIEFLKQKKCDRIQGYIVSPPLEREAFVNFLTCPE